MTLQQQINKGREDAELAVFWEQMASFLPKSIERAALGDDKIFRAFKAVYPMMKKHIQISLLEAVKESGPEEMAGGRVTKTNGELGYIQARGFNECRSLFLSPIDEALKQLKGKADP